MRRILLIGLIVVAAAVVVLFAREVRKADAPEQAAQEQGALMASPPTQATERIKVTARGIGIKAEAWEHSNARQGRVLAPGLIRDTVNFPGQIGLKVGDGIGMSTVAIDSLAADEGNLFRIHVDRPVDGKGHSGQLIVIGFYDALDSQAAYDGQAMECKKCRRVTVCGVNPECY